MDALGAGPGRRTRHEWLHHGHSGEHHTDALCGLHGECKIKPTGEPLTADEQRLVEFMNEAAAYARVNGEIPALEAFNYPDGSFVKDELYVFALGMHGTALAHPFQPELVGTNRSDATDIRDTKHVRDGIALTRYGSGFQEL